MPKFETWSCSQSADKGSKFELRMWPKNTKVKAQLDKLKMKSNDISSNENKLRNKKLLIILEVRSILLRRLGTLERQAVVGDAPTSYF